MGDDVIVEWAGSLLGLLGSFLLAANLRGVSRFGWIAFLLSNFALITLFVRLERSGMVLMQAGFVLTSVLGLFRSGFLTRQGVAVSNDVNMKCGEIQISFKGGSGAAEPVCVQFPGGRIEVAPNSDGSFWAQLHVCSPSSVLDTRLYFEDAQSGKTSERSNVPVRHLAVRVQESRGASC